MKGNARVEDSSYLEIHFQSPMKHGFRLFSRVIMVITVLATAHNTFAQGDLPTDFLSKDFHAERRQKLREKMPPRSVSVFFANPVRNRANDVDYVYHQDPD